MKFCIEKLVNKISKLIHYARPEHGQVFHQAMAMK